MAKHNRVIEVTVFTDAFINTITRIVREKTGIRKYENVSIATQRKLAKVINEQQHSGLVTVRPFLAGFIGWVAEYPTDQPRGYDHQ